MRPLLWALPLLLLVSAGCGALPAKDAGSSTPPAFYEITDATGREVVLPRKAERVILLAPSFLNIMHAAGGDFIAWADSPSAEVPAYAKGKDTVGYTFQVNVESVISKKPDLVIGLKGLHDRFGDVLKQNGIPFLILSVSSYQEVMEAAEIMGDVTGHHEEGVAAAKKLESQVKEAAAKVPTARRTCAIIHGTPHGVTLEGRGTIATETAALLHIENVFTLSNEMKLPPFSLESLAAKDPDIIFLTTMAMPGMEEAVFQKSLHAQPAWAGLRAVREGHVYFLPQSLFLSSPGMDYPEAVRYMAKVVGN